MYPPLFQLPYSLQNKTTLLTSPMRGRGSSTHRVCLCVCVSVCYRSSGHCGYLTSETKLSKESAGSKELAIWIKMFSSRVMTVFSSPRKLYLVLVPQNRHQRVTSAVTRLLVREAWRLATPALPQTKRHKETN